MNCQSPRKPSLDKDHTYLDAKVFKLGSSLMLVPWCKRRNCTAALIPNPKVLWLGRYSVKGAVRDCTEESEQGDRRAYVLLLL